MKSRGLLVGRYVLLTAWLSAWAIRGFRHVHPIHSVTDWDTLRYGGKALFGIEPFYHGTPLHLYALFPELSVGPPAVAINGAAQVAFGRHGGYRGDMAVLAVMIGLGVLCVWLLERTARLWLPQRRAAALTTVAAVPLLAVWGQGFGVYGHLEDALAITCLIAVCSLLARQGSGWWVGLLLGFAISCKPWAVIFVPIVLVLVWRERLHAVAAMVLAAVLPWLPFFLADRGTFGAGDRVWPVLAGAPMHLLFPGWAYSPRLLRPAQFLVGMLVVALIVRRRGVADAVLAGFAVKVLFDPDAYWYYGVGPMAAAALLDVRRGSRVPRWTLATLLAEYLIPLWASPTVAAAGLLVWSVGAVVLLCAGERDVTHPVGLLGRGRDGARRLEGRRIDGLIGDHQEPGAQTVDAHPAVHPAR